MILDDLQEADRYAALHPGFAAAFDFLRHAPLMELEVGRTEIDGTRLFVIIGRDLGRGHERARLEAHRQYIDIQYVISGHEQIGWKTTSACQGIDLPYNAERDIAFFTDRPETWVAVEPKNFVILYPQDAHAPLAGAGEMHKAVVKVAVDWASQS
jgi:YhcH/YjgK/YiaL family protein